jgi:hypothetical protein
MAVGACSSFHSHRGAHPTQEHPALGVDRCSPLGPASAQTRPA